MADVYHNEVIQETPFPGEVDTSLPIGTSNPAGTFNNTESKPKSFPTKKIAVELLSSALNTKSLKILQKFELTQSGAIQIGDFKEGVTGDLRLTPNGLTARDKAGITTFAIDGTTGDATFKGTIQSGAIVTGLVDVGNNSVVIDGENRRMVFYDENGVPVILIGNA